MMKKLLGSSRLTWVFLGAVVALLVWGPFTSAQLSVSDAGMKLVNWLGSTAPTVGQKDMAASIPVTVASDQAAFPVTVANTSTTSSGTITSTGSCPGTSCVSVTVTPGSVLGIEITGTWVATLVPEATIEGTTFQEVVPIPVAMNRGPYEGTGAITTVFPGTKSNVIWRINTAGFTTFRVRATAYTSGTATITYRVIPGTLNSEEMAPARSVGTISAACSNPCLGSAETANSFVQIAMNGRSGVNATILTNSSFIGTLECRGSNDGYYWVAATCVLGNGDRGASLSSAVYTFTTGDVWLTSPWGGMNFFRIHATAYTSGSITFGLSASNTEDQILAFSTKAGNMKAQRSIALGGSDNGTSCTGSQPCHRDLQVSNSPPTPSDYGLITRQGVETTYSAGTTLKTATAAGTGPFFAICGSSTKTVRVQRLMISGTVATAAVWGDVIVKKTSTSTSSGTATALTQVPHDSGSAAGTANLVNFYTVLATTGTVVGIVANATQLFPVTAISATLQPNPPPLLFAWGQDNDSEAPTLRGTAQCLQANFGTTTTNAPTLSVNVTWTEK